MRRGMAVMPTHEGKAAGILNRSWELGVVPFGGLSEFILVDGDPFGDLGVQRNLGTLIPITVKDSSLVKNELK